MKLLLTLIAILFCTSAHAASITPALTATFGHEGGFQAMHADSGNWTGGKVGIGVLKGTKYGIAAASYPHEDIRNLTLDRAAAIYSRDFWGALRLDAVKSQIIANEVFDGAVNMGAGTEAKILQKAINKAGYPRKRIDVDGVIGKATVSRLNDVDQVALYCHLIGMRYGRYELIVEGNPIKEQFFKTWVYRIKNNVISVVNEVEKRKLPVR